MRPLRAVPAIALLATLVLSAQGCAPRQQPPSTSAATSPPSRVPALPITGADTCPEVATRTVDALQGYVDGFADVTPGGLEGAVSERQSTLADISAAMRERASQLDCTGLRDELAEELERLGGPTPVADTIAATLRSSLLGTTDPSDPGAEDVEVADVEELRAAVSNAGSGSVITLSPGTYELDQTLVFFRSVTLRGPRDGNVVLESSAEGAALLSLADGELRLEDLTVRHTGARPASVIVVRAGGHRFARIEVTGARRSEDGVGGFGLAVQPALGGGDAAHEVRGASFRDNEGGGVLIGGTATARLRDLTVEGPGGCGVCYAEEAGGSLQDSEVRGHDIGIRIEAAAAPTIRGGTIRDNVVGVGAIGDGEFRLVATELADNETGLEMGGSGAPVVEGVLAVDNTATGVLAGGTTTARFVDLEVRGDTEVGLVISEGAAPAVDGATVHTSGEVGVVATGSSAGTLAEVDVAGQRIGLQVEADAAPAVDSIALDQQQDVAIILTGDSEATLTTVTCRDPDSGVLVILEQADPNLGDGVDCRVEDQRE